MIQNFLICFQTPYDSVRYITNQLSSVRSLQYYKFLAFISDIFVSDFTGFKNHLDKFDTILVDLDTHTWEIQNTEKKKVEFKELFEFNEKREEEEKENKSKYEDLNRKKAFIKKISHTPNIGYKHDSLGKYNKDFYRIK